MRDKAQGKSNTTTSGDVGMLLPKKDTGRETRDLPPTRKETSLRIDDDDRVSLHVPRCLFGAGSLTNIFFFFFFSHPQENEIDAILDIEPVLPSYSSRVKRGGRPRDMFSDI